MKPILLKKNQIEIPFQDADGKTLLTLWFDKSDEPMKRLEKEFDKMKKSVAKMTEETTTFEDSKIMVEDAVSALFGPSAFEKLYELNPSLYIIVDYLNQISIGIKEELESETLKDVEQKYLK